MSGKTDVGQGRGVELKKSGGVGSAVALVVASMIGTGVFTSLGFQLEGMSSGWVVLVLWILGAVLAGCGAWVYARLALRFPQSGGEAHYLTELWHPSLGMMAGLVSVVFGFAAPTAVTALAFGGYLHGATGWDRQWAAAGVIGVGALAHSFSAAVSGRVQMVATGVKLFGILVFLGAAWCLPGKGDVDWSADWSGMSQQMFSGVFAVSLLFVFYAYSGWNAAVYGLEEWEEPEKTVPRALKWGTGLVGVLYVGLNAAFLHAAPVASLKGVVEVGYVAALSLWGAEVGRWVSGAFAVSLFASVSAMLWAGPRILASMGRKMSWLQWARGGGGVPHLALFVQVGLALLMVGMTGLRNLMAGTQVGLSVVACLVVAGAWVKSRQDRSEGGKDWVVPSVPVILFLGIQVWAVVMSFRMAPVVSWVGLGVVLGAWLLWFPLRYWRR